MIQPRSLEILDQMGIAESAVARGKPFRAINYVVNGVLARIVPIGDFGNGMTVSRNPLVSFLRVHLMPRLVSLLPRERHIA